jgi:hypothetical protein
MWGGVLLRLWSADEVVSTGFMALSTLMRWWPGVSGFPVLWKKRVACYTGKTVLARESLL